MKGILLRKTHRGTLLHDNIASFSWTTGSTLSYSRQTRSIRILAIASLLARFCGQRGINHHHRD